MNSARFRPGGIGGRISNTAVPRRFSRPCAGQCLPELVATGTAQGNVASASADQSWQAALWRRLCAELGVTEGQHPAQAFQRALDASVAGVGDDTLPKSAHVFCLPTLPPLHLSLLQSLGRRIDLHVYLLNPCREYWFEVIDRRRLAYLAARGRDQDLYHEQGHPLLASWGQQTQSQLALIVDASDETLIDDAHFSRNPDKPDHSLLARLQNSILEMTDLAPGSAPVADHDRSIEIHVCHSLTREIEVLHDRLLALFAGPAAPALGDILVVTPDLDAAAPLIDAVFGTAPKHRYIPFAITGRARSHVISAARALLDLLALASSRFTVSGVFGLLQQPAVARRFGLVPDDL